MNATRETLAVRRRPEALRWGACFALALSFHAAGAAALLARWSEDTDLVANAPLIMIELAALPVAPDVKPTEVPPGPQQIEARPEPEQQKLVEKMVELPPEPQAEPLLAVTPPPKQVEKPAEKKLPQKHASVTSAPSTAENKAQRAAAPMPGASSHYPDAVPNWKSQLVARLERYKRAPTEAPNASGIATLAFSVDRSGGVHRARIARSSGSSLLDAETLALVERAAPLPPPPPEISGAQIAIVVPIRYNMR
ncbi:MAG TPA: TonB family protein [Pseudolabrys sp.]|nr:TonB family protein [Pseudolabrys sp.]